MLETKRLRLRPFRRGDEDELARHLGDWEITRQLALNPHPFDMDHAEDWINECLAQPNGIKHGLRFAIEAPDETGLVGGAGLSPVGAGFELGYWIGRSRWGRGYATEAALALVDAGFAALSLEELTALVFGENPASVRVLEKIGFEVAEIGDAPEAESAARAVRKYCLRRPASNKALARP